MIGETISHYTILERLGEGGMGIVYKARDTRLDRPVAIKFLPPHLNRQDSAKKRFVQEAKAASAIDHPNIGTIYEIDETPEGRTFIAMAFCEGETLRERLERGSFAFDEASDIVLQAADGLAGAHEKGIIHRDIKPSNIVIAESGRVVIIDFGLAKLAAQSRLTREGTTLGTAAYMSPEQARGDEVDRRTDIWSLGVVFQEMLTGRNPFKGEYEHAVLYSILNDEPEDITEFGCDAPAGLGKILAKVLAKTPNDRYQRIEDFAADLRKLKERHTTKHGVDDSTRENRSIAVLPFVDMSPERDQEYFCEGLAEELINALTHVKSLRVAARTSAFALKGGKYDVREIGEKLDVDTVLEGSIRKAGSRLRITAQLVSAADGYHLWSEKYDRNMEDIFAIQDEISLAIVDQLKIELLGEEASLLVKRGTENLEAYDLYVKGRFFWEKRGLWLQKSIECFEEAIRKDPNYAEPYAGIADAYSLLSFYGFLPSRDALPKARENALRALEIDNTIAEAHNALGWIHQFYDWNLEKAEREFKRAIELNPAYTPAHYWYSIVLLFTGRLEEATRENELAIEVDPLSVQAQTQYGWNLLGKREFDRSIEQLKRALELNPDYALAHWLLGLNYYLVSKYDDAVAETEKSAALSGKNPWMLSSLGFLYGRVGRKAEARKILNELLDRSTREYVQSLYFSYVYMGLDQFDEALAWLQKSYEARDQYLIVIGRTWDPAFEQVQDDPRFKAIVRRIVESTL